MRVEIRGSGSGRIWGVGKAVNFFQVLSGWLELEFPLLFCVVNGDLVRRGRSIRPLESVEGRF